MTTKADAPRLTERQNVGAAVTTPPKYDEKRDFYQQLGIADDATVEQIRRAKHEKARLLHPDRRTEAKLANQAMVEVNDAAAVLLDATARKRYDAERRNHWVRKLIPDFVKLFNQTFGQVKPVPAATAPRGRGHYRS